MKKSPQILFIILAVVMIVLFTIISFKREVETPAPGIKPPREKFQSTPTPDSQGLSPVETGTPGEKQPPKASTSPFQLNVKVSKEDRVPVKGAKIELFPDRTVMLPLKLEPLATARTDGKGEVLMGWNLSGKYILKVSADSFSNELRAVSFEAAASRKNLSFIMKSEMIISGVVKNQRGEPLPNILVGPLTREPEAETSLPFLPEFTQTDQKGRFLFRGLREALYGLQVTRSGYKTSVRDQIKAPFENLEITLIPGGTTAKGITAGSRDGQPCKDIGVLLVNNNMMLYAVSDGNGIFAFGNLDQGQYYLEPILNDRKVGKPVSFTCDGNTPVEDIILKVHQGIILSGIVQESLNRKPLAGIILELKDRTESLTATSDDNGRFIFQPCIPEGGIDIQIVSPEFYVAEESGTYQKTFSIHEYMPDSDMENIVIPLEKEYALNGVVEDMKKEDRGKYKVKIESMESESKRKPVWLKLGDDLTFTTKYMGGGNNAAGVFTEKGDLAGRPLEFSLDPRSQPPLLILKLSPPASVNGRVLQHTGDPLDQSSVVAEGIMSAHKATTDDSGMFSFETYEKQLSFEVTSSRYSQTLRREIALPTSEEIVFRFTLGKILSGMVVTVDETPVGFASISYNWLNPNTGENVRKQITTDKTGSFSITDAISDYLDRLVCEGPSTGETGLSQFGKVEFKDIALPQEDFKIVLPRAVNLRLNFIDENDNPYSGNISLEVQVWKPDKNVFEMDRHESKGVREGQCAISSLNPGIYVFHAKSSEGYTGSSESIELRESEGEAEATIQLHQAEKIYGYVYDRETNTALQGVNLIFKFSGRSQVQHGTTTNTEGYFEMKGLLDGDIRLQFGKNGYITTEEEVSITKGKADISLPLSIYMDVAQASLKGVVYNPQNKPEPAVSLTIRSLKADEEILAISRTGVSDNEGRFTFDKLDQGEYLLNADKERSSGSMIVILQPQEKKAISITLMAKVQVKGTLETKQTILYEQPLLFSNLVTQRNHLAHLTPDHKFEIYLPPGEYRIHIGDSEISGDISITDDTDVFELDLSF
jgi:hypothetical protein